MNQTLERHITGHQGQLFGGRFGLVFVFRSDFFLYMVAGTHHISDET
jgi:hypothetical protein